YQSVSGGAYQGNLSNQMVQPLFDQGKTGTPNNPNTVNNPAAADTTAGWRQARVDLGDLAGKSNITLRFDFSTAGSMGTGLPAQNGSTMSSLPGAKLSDGQTVVINNSYVSGFDPQNSNA